MSTSERPETPESSTLFGLAASLSPLPAAASARQTTSRPEKLAATAPPGSADELAELRTALAQSERQRAELLAAQAEFLRAASHDLRAPLRHVTSYGPLVSELLQDSGVSAEVLDEAQSFMATIDQSARRMGRMLDGLLSLTRVAHAPWQAEQLSLTQVLGNAKEQAERLHVTGAKQAGHHLAPLASITWQIEVAEVQVAGDAELLTQMLTQLLCNAIKFSRKQAAPQITVQASLADGGQVTLSVQDNGVGFDMARAAGLFGVYQRLHGEREFEGEGVGLAIALAIAQRHGARLTLQAAPGAGCTAQIDFAAGLPG